MGGGIKGGEGLMISVEEGSLVIGVCARSERVSWIIIIEDGMEPNNHMLYGHLQSVR